MMIVLGAGTKIWISLNAFRKSESGFPALGSELLACRRRGFWREGRRNLAQ